MKTNFALAAASFIAVAALSPSGASAASCDIHKSKFLWRSCMSKEVDKLTAAIGAKALNLCYGKTDGASGPTAVDERLACRIDRLTKTLQGMN